MQTCVQRLHLKGEIRLRVLCRSNNDKDLWKLFVTQSKAYLFVYLLVLTLAPAQISVKTSDDRARAPVPGGAWYARFYHDGYATCLLQTFVLFGFCKLYFCFCNSRVHWYWRVERSFPMVYTTPKGRFELERCPRQRKKLFRVH